MAEFGVRYALALAVVTAMLAAASLAGRVLQRRLQKNNEARRIQIVETVALAPQAALHLVRIDNRELLVASGSAAVVRDAIDT
ncbi:MAG TPA: flagellar biosynthetic protein FliO [Candidatus Dormibacteraeota bacterium]|nr:flagellar biosynthetic protein FliO [Candidatus Dormibacteraeota bacterium]